REACGVKLAGVYAASSLLLFEPGRLGLEAPLRTVTQDRRLSGPVKARGYASERTHPEIRALGQPGPLLKEKAEETAQMSSSCDPVLITMSQRNTNGLPGVTSNDLKTYSEGAVLSFHNICYRVKVKSGFLLGRKIVEKEILKNIKYVHELLFKLLY
ncbi:ATP-binding cassette sub-family G member 2, partial [Galemys pyrenaicus]